MLTALRNKRCGVAIVATIVLAVIACGTEVSEFGPDGSGGTSGGASSGDPGGSPGTFQPGTAGDDAGTEVDFSACAVDRQQSKLAPLDLVLMQDTSGSMWNYSSGTTTKWTAIKSALGAFMTDPGSAGIGMGIQFFPLFENGIPNGCTSNAECGPSGTCVHKACSRTGNLCASQADCQGGNNVCTQLQRCATMQEAICLSTADCFSAGLNPPTCNQPIIKGVCQGEEVSCNVADYSGLAAPVAALPGSATAINAALAARIPNGQTPTHAALQGAVAAAKAHAAKRPDAVVAVVLSTDGIPYTDSKCNDDTTAIAAVASAAAGGTPSIKTFVVGVLSPQDNSPNAASTLNAIASAGGTKSATIIGASANTTADFIAALQKIRGTSLPCEFALPVPEAGTPDYDKVNVLYTDPATKAQTLIKYSTTVAGCDAKAGGWYYNVDPATGALPSKVILCPASCAAVQQGVGGIVNVVQGCKTQTRVPK